jgi:hypothetical protein
MGHPHFVLGMNVRVGDFCKPTLCGSHSDKSKRLVGRKGWGTPSMMRNRNQMRHVGNWVPHEHGGKVTVHVQVRGDFLKDR